MFDFRALLNAWRGQGLVSEMFDQFQEMLQDASAMFDISRKALQGRLEDAGAADELRALDKKINRTQRTIRRKVVEHLSVNPGVDVPASLVLMSIIKDAERLGDYARDVFWAAGKGQGAAQAPGYAEMVDSIAADIEKILADTCKALATSDEALARDIMEREGPLKARCDEILPKLDADRLPSTQTVTLAVLSRYFRRIVAHAANIASSVINSVEWLDYKPREPK